MNWYVVVYLVIAFVVAWLFCLAVAITTNCLIEKIGRRRKPR